MLGSAVDCYFFDLDKTLYDYDFRFRLPELARLSGQSQYRLAKDWWAAGRERRAEAGEWPTAAEYLDAFAAATDGRRLELAEWAQARALAMTPIAGTIRALERASELGMVALLSNNPSPLYEAFGLLAPEVAGILGENLLVSYMVQARKPSPELYARALERYGITADRAFLADDTQANVAGARMAGWTAHHFVYVDEVPQTDALMAAVEAFAAR